MAVLSWISVAGVALVTGCYSPELRDCVVSCASAADCAPEQICGTDGMCASPDVAGRCAGTMAVVDASLPMTDTPTTVDAASPVDAAPPIDAAPQHYLRIDLAGRGGVTVAGIGMCHHTASMLPCPFPVVGGVALALQAIPDPENRFDKWESGPCMGQDETCTFVPVLLVTDVKAKFRAGSD